MVDPARRPAARARALATPVLALLAPLALAPDAACDAGDRPPMLGGYGIDGGTGEADGFDFDASQAPTCNLGPEGGVCACVDQPLLTDLPNLYFVLDRSGSMAESDKWDTIRLVVAQTMEKIGPRARFGAAIFPDPKLQPSDNCGSGLEVLSLRPGDSPAGTRGPATSALLYATSLPPSGGTPTAATLAALTPKLKTFSGRTFVILATDGGPNCDSYATCDVDHCIPNIEGAQGCPPGGTPNCCADPSQRVNCLDSAATITAVTNLAAAPNAIPTYVVGVPGSGPYADLLDQLATAGATARPQKPYYYAVGSTDQAAFQSALSQIAAKITASCTLMLDAVPPDPNKVNVFLDEKPVPQAGPDGWSLSGKTVTLLGATCSKVMSGDVLDVRIVAGCPTVLY